jgi:hypothetical protein
MIWMIEAGMPGNVNPESGEWLFIDVGFAQTGAAAVQAKLVEFLFDIRRNRNQHHSLILLVHTANSVAVEVFRSKHARIRYPQRAVEQDMGEAANTRRLRLRQNLLLLVRRERSGMMCGALACLIFLVGFCAIHPASWQVEKNAFSRSSCLLRVCAPCWVQVLRNATSFSKFNSATGESRCRSANP